MAPIGEEADGSEPPQGGVKLEKELASAKDEIARLKEELAKANERAEAAKAEAAKALAKRSLPLDLMQSVNEFRSVLAEQLDLTHKSVQQFRQQLIESLEKPLPFPRKRQVFAVSLLMSLLPLSITLFGILAWYAVFYDSTRILFTLLFVYCVHIWTDKSCERGSKATEFLKRHVLWSWFADYFPVELRKMDPDTEFDPKNVYLFGYHPHGVISVGCFVNFASSVTGFDKLFPGLSMHPATLRFNFNMPFFREVLIRMGCISVSAGSIKHVLSSGPGSAVIVVPGGAAEALDARPGVHELTLKKRSGFFRIALQHGAHLVPTYSFGENELYEQVANERGSMLRQVQEKALKALGFSMPYFCGAGSQPLGSAGGIPFNPVPNRYPVITIVGNPIPCERIEQPTQEQIDTLKSLYIERVKEIFDRFADQYAPDRKEGLRIVN
eukprot:TRINITY_DN13993_c0_g1_i1.p1 TRINITY_DN13993_c0_g1~~TRINITY_DN13993_c0_g1_i1.p1  ORF type:complete len:468 (+),score=103.62 TRINITY_DN13993_c0_g1_i1:85-1404(+)